jgi:large subunit ribosomal protein L35
MTKLKTNSSAKKRFKVTAKKKVVYKKIGKRHGMVKRSNSQIRDLRKSAILSEADTKNVLKHLMPYNN